MFFDHEPLIIIILGLHPLLTLGAWIYLYASAKPARDMLFWGVIALAIPYFGALSMLLYYRSKRPKPASKHT